MTLFLCLMLLLLSAIVFAQDSPASSLRSAHVGQGRKDGSASLLQIANVEDNPSLHKTNALPDAPGRPLEGLSSAAPPETPVRAGSRAANSPFWIASGMMMTSTIVNAEAIARCRPASCTAVPDAIRSRGALYGIGIPASIGVSYMGYRIKRGGSKWWIVPIAAVTAGNAVYAWHAAQWSK
jgi:hypothetical protein